MMTTIYRYGNKGDGVKRIQRALNIYPDGVFGMATEEAVRAFQRENGLTPDGIVGPATLSALLKQQILLHKSTRRIDEIIVHCTATPEGRDYTVDDIRNWHRAQGWADIGYHYVVYRDGSVHAGRPVNVAGAHCVNHNTHSIGVVYVGGTSSLDGRAKDTRTLAQKTALRHLLQDLRKIYPTATIHGHKDFAHKDCPSFNATQEYSDI